MLEKGIANWACDNGGQIYALLVPTNKDFPSLMNPSIIKIKDQLLINLRNTNYILYHAENNKNEHVWGPLCYLHPENTSYLSTNNILCYLDNDLQISSYSTTDFSFLDQNPIWEFRGLEDCRLVYWDNNLFYSGVRRDTTPNGQGRIELSKILYLPNKSVEIERTRIPALGDNDSYCEKNWMPILDKPYHWVKWTNPTEVVYYDRYTLSTSSVILKNKISCDECYDFRGGSQVIPYNNGYLAIIHEVDLTKTILNKKDGIYTHRFVYWDKDFNIQKISTRFNFMDAKIEFVCGLCEHNDSLLITFGYQDNAAFLLSLPKTLLSKIL